MLFWVFWDIGVGALLARGIGYVMGETTHWTIAFGILAAVAPDIDFVYCYLVEKMDMDSLMSQHRKFHVPMVYLPTTVVLLFMVLFSVKCELSPEIECTWIVKYLFIWILAAVAHFMADTIDPSCEGIRWLYPFSNKIAVWNRLIPKLWITMKERKKYCERFRDRIRKKYFNPKHHVPEVVFCLLSVVLSLTTLKW